MDIIKLIHRFLGETMLLIALVGVVLAIIGLIRKQALERAEDIFGLVYAGLLALQVLLGFVGFGPLLALAGTSLLTSKFILHPILMILALIVVLVSRKRCRGPVPARHWAQLGAYGLSLLLIFAGRMLLV